jgi:hypothetical protein
LFKHGRVGEKGAQYEGQRAGRKARMGTMRVFGGWY